MPTYSVIVEVIQTRAYQVRADDIDAAADLVRDEYEAMQYDVLETTLDTMEVTDSN